MDQEERIRLANQHSPPCPKCNGKTEVDVNRGDSYHRGETAYRGTWYLRCTECSEFFTARIGETEAKS